MVSDNGKDKETEIMGKDDCVLVVGLEVKI